MLPLMLAFSWKFCCSEVSYSAAEAVDYSFFLHFAVDCEHIPDSLMIDALPQCFTLTLSFVLWSEWESHSQF